MITVPVGKLNVSLATVPDGLNQMVDLTLCPETLARRAYQRCEQRLSTRERFGLLTVCGSTLILKP